MTPEEAVARITASEPRFIATDTDKDGIAYYGCVTKEGRERFRVESDMMHVRFGISEKSTPAELTIAHELINREMVEMRKVLLWRCLKHLVTGDVGKHPDVTGFVAQVIYTPQKPELVTPDDFHQMFQSQN